MKLSALLLTVLLSITSIAVGQTTSDNVKLTDLFTLDQAARKAKTVDWQKLNTEDEKRREEVHLMLQNGEIHTGNDYYHAALIYQHGQRHEDFLLAHVLAVSAMSFGNKDARWLSAATLDRYLLAISQPQIYGTQFESSPGKTGTWTQRTMDTSLLSDSMRSAACVVTVAEQRKILDEVNHGGTFRSTNAPDCK
jgi:hypothetical protein